MRATSWNHSIVACNRLRLARMMGNSNDATAVGVLRVSLCLRNLLLSSFVCFILVKDPEGVEVAVRKLDWPVTGVREKFLIRGEWS